jgi:hypothetical protein
MNAQDAAALIPLHRPGRNAAGPVQKAVRIAQDDPELSGLLAVQTHFDTQILGVIQSIVPPADLGHKLRAAGARPDAPKAKASSQVVLTAVLGVLLIVGFVAWTVLERMEKFPGREAAERMLGVTSKMSGVELDPVSLTAGGMQDWFYMRGFEGFSVPPELAPLPAVGSRIFRIDGHPIAQVVVDRHNSFLYVFRASDFGVEIPADQPWRVIDHEEWTAALERRGDVCSMIAFKGTRVEMQEFLVTLKAR